MFTTWRNSAQLVALFLFGVSIIAIEAYIDTQAIDKCKVLHGTNDSDPNSAYLNDRCLLQCGIKGEYWWHKINEGLRCSMGMYECQDGRCVSSKVIGTIGVKVTGAELFESANAFAYICVQNSSVTGKLPLLDRSKCISCQTTVQSKSRSPKWNMTNECHNLNRFVFEDTATVFVEIWDKQELTIQRYLGRSEITIEHLMARAQNRQEMALPMIGGKHSGQVNVIVNWTGF